MKTKKSNLGVTMLVSLSLGAIVFLVIAFLVPSLLGKGKAEAADNVQASGDYDSDGVANYFDKCKCTPAETDNGCPPNVDPDKPDHNPYDKCPKEMCPSWKPQPPKANCV